MGKKLLVYLTNLFFLLTLLNKSQCIPRQQINQENAVVILTKNNFTQFMKEHEYVLVDFYAPWCPHSKALAPKYAKAAEILSEKNPKIKLAMVDADAEVELSEKFGIKDYPTVKFIRKNMVVLNYDQDRYGRNPENIVNWVLKKSGPTFEKVSTVKEAVALVNSYDVVIMGFFKNKDSRSAKVFFEVANTNEDLNTFGYTSNEDVFSKFHVYDETIVLYKRVEKQTFKFTGEVTIDRLKHFIQTHSEWSINEYSEKRRELYTQLKYLF